MFSGFVKPDPFSFQVNIILPQMFVKCMWLGKGEGLLEGKDFCYV